MSLLEAARRNTDINIGGKKVYFFQDFSIGVQKRRAETSEIRKRLREAGFRYAFMYPATIKVIESPTVKAVYLYNTNDSETCLNSIEAQRTTNATL